MGEFPHSIRPSSCGIWTTTQKERKVREPLKGREMWMWVYVSRSCVSNSVGILWVIERQRTTEICTVGNWALFPLSFFFLKALFFLALSSVLTCMCWSKLCWRAKILKVSGIFFLYSFLLSSTQTYDFLVTLTQRVLHALSHSPFLVLWSVNFSK